MLRAADAESTVAAASLNCSAKAGWALTATRNPATETALRDRKHATAWPSSTA